MINYLPYIFGISSLLLGIYLFLVFFEIYKPKKLTEQTKEKSESFKSMMKIFSVILIFNGGYDLLNSNPERYKIEASESKKEISDEIWTDNDRQILVEKCIKESGQIAIDNPNIVKEYCECSIDNVMLAMTKKEYLINSQKTREEQMKVQMPLFQMCYDNMTKKLDSLYKNIR
jgi:hypothetical protein